MPLSAHRSLISSLIQPIRIEKLRNSSGSILVALGNDPAYVMAQLGHTDPAFTLRVYTNMMRRDPGERERLRALVDGGPVVEAATSTTVGEVGAAVASGSKRLSGGCGGG